MIFSGGEHALEKNANLWKKHAAAHYAAHGESGVERTPRVRRKKFCWRKTKIESTLKILKAKMTENATKFSIVIIKASFLIYICM